MYIFFAAFEFDAVVSGLGVFSVVLGFNLVAEWIRFTLFGIVLPTIKLKVHTFSGL